MFINETIFIYIHISFPIVKHCLLLKERIRISWVIIQTKAKIAVFPVEDNRTVNLKLSKQKKINLQCPSFFKKVSFSFYLFIYFGLGLVFVALHSLSLVAASEAYPQVAVWRLLIAVASLAAEALGCGLQWLQHVGSVVVALRISQSSAGGIFPDQGSNPCLLD